MRASILIPTFRRDELLKKGLKSIVRQHQNMEIIILNDSEPSVATSKIAWYYGCRYIQCRNIVDQWRVPGFAFNIGAKQAKTDVLILTCPEIWHHDPCLDTIVKAVEDNHKCLATGVGKDDKMSYILDNDNSFHSLRPLNTNLPFLMAVSRTKFFEIGGYDEELVGYGFDDEDLVQRCEKLGFVLYGWGGEYTKRIKTGKKEKNENLKVWYKKTEIENKKKSEENISRGKLIANEGKHWGKALLIKNFSDEIEI